MHADERESLGMSEAEDVVVVAVGGRCAGKGW